MVEPACAQYFPVAHGDESQRDGDEDAVLHEELMGPRGLGGADDARVEGLEARSPRC